MARVCGLIYESEELVTLPAHNAPIHGNLFICHIGILQGLDTRDATTVPTPSSLTELPEDFDAKNIRVGIPKVSLALY